MADKLMKILFVGVGSIAKRHIRNLARVSDKRKIPIRIDIIRSGHGSELPEDISGIIFEQYSLQDEVPSDYDVAFITNPTSLHYETIRTYSSHTHYIFIEKPVFDNVDYNISELNLREDGIYYVACPLRYSAVLQYVKKNVDCTKAIAVRSICSSYLPDWRPGTDYRSTYSAHKGLGGGVSIDLIHEWDYLTWLFGEPSKVSSIIGRYSSLEIDSDDSALYVASNDHMTYELHLDYYGRKTERQLQIFMPDQTIEADLTNSKVIFRCQGVEDKVIDLTEERDVFQARELEHFFDIIDGKCENDSGIEHAVKVLNLTQGVC